MFAGILLTFIYLLMTELPSFSDRVFFGDITTFPLFFGIVIFAYSITPLVLPLKNSMAKPETFVAPFGILNVGMIISTIVYIIVGVLAYWRFGDLILGSVTLNLDDSLV
jgi:solute carrier family 36 (proton-coupled amino acid transporter)